MKRFVTALVACVASVSALAQQERPQDRWNLADLYPSIPAWNDDAAKLEKQLQQVSACKGQLGTSAKRLNECLGLQYDSVRLFYRLAVYSNELNSEDTGATPGLELQSRVGVLGSKLSEATSWARPEILAIGAEKIEAFHKQEPGLAIYRHPLRDILRNAPHTLDAAGEAIVASFSLSAGAASNTYQVLANADFPWPTIRLDNGRELKLDEPGFETVRESSNRDERKRGFDAFYAKWKEYERTFGVTYYSDAKEDSVYARIRKYPDSFARSMDGTNLPLAVYDALVKSANDNLPTLHRYFKLRGRMLGVAEMRYYDVYPPLVSGGREFPIDEGVKVMLESAKPLGDAYVAAMRKGLADRWMDVYPRPRKQSGAHMAGAAYDVHPYLLINYTNNYSSVSTIAHEWGHAMHSYLSNRAQPFPTARYATFVAEIASTTNEAFLLDYMLKNAANDDERLLYLGSALETLRGTFFRQVMFAEFEREVHARVDKGEPMSGDKLTRIYGEILRRYHGDKEGVVKIDDLYTIEWARIPHFYSSFYVFQYATSIAAGSLFAQSILKGEPGARERYLKLLEAGSSGYPYDLVKAAGVDLATAAPYTAVATSMNRIMDQIETILARRGK
jgi:oligoendopeptidase F